VSQEERDCERLPGKGALSLGPGNSTWNSETESPTISTFQSVIISFITSLSRRLDGEVICGRDELTYAHYKMILLAASYVAGVRATGLLGVIVCGR
jgi:hypothetical protein